MLYITADNPLMTYFGQPGQFDKVQLLDPDLTPMRYLSPVELAMGKIIVGEPSDLRRGIVYETAARLRLFESRGEGHHYSLNGLARLVEALHFVRPRPLRDPLRGLEVLRHLDLDDGTGVEIHIFTPSLTDPLLYRPIRLRDRIAELSSSKAA